MNTQRLCNCEEPQPPVMRTSQSTANPERRYFICRSRGRRGDCGYWDWLDPELTSYYKDSFEKIKLERDMAVEQLLKEGRNNVTAPEGGWGSSQLHSLCVFIEPVREDEECGWK